MGLFVGGTGDANKIDDYEEGTWTAVIKSGSNTITQTSGSPQFTYTKIGNMVYVNFKTGGCTTA